ncbi:MAG: HD domain-containing protein [Mariniphaga sp.]|nr:HD domain-containing protein [Mariniphaga sp.]
MNEFYAPFGISLVLEEDIIKMYRTDTRIFQNKPEVKRDIEGRIDIIWNRDEYYWYLDSKGIDKLSKTELKFTSDRTRDVLKEVLFGYIDAIIEEDLKSSIKNYIDSNDVFYSIPAATYYHHTYENGLLEHTVQVCELCNNVFTYLKEKTPIDKDILIAGAILHDIGKINCYSCTDGVTTITEIYKEQDHIINGVKIVSSNIRSEKIDKIIHIIASHHQTKDMGSPVEPIYNEAWLVHVADNLSANILGG